MPTKPVTSPPIWASNANWTVGPHAGQPTKVAPSAGEAQNGQVGGQTYKGQWSNYLGNLFATWIANWLAVGSSTGAADAHVVETDAAGITNVRQLSALGTTGDTFGVAGQGVGSGPGVLGVGGNGVPGGAGDTLTGGYGVRGLSGTAAELAGVLGIGRSGADHYGVLGYGAGARPGVHGESTSTTGTGVTGQGGSVSGVGVFGTGGGSGAGVRGTGSLGVWGVSTDATNNYGVAGHAAAGADDGCAGVRGTGFGDAIGVLGVSVDGYALRATPTGTTRAALRLDPQDSPPSTALEGDIYFDNDSVGSGPLDRDELRIRSRGAWRSVMTETLGYVRGFAVNTATVTATTVAVPITVVSPSLAAPNDPRRTGTIYLRVSGECRRSASGTTQNAILRLIDDTDAVTIATRTVQLFQDGSDAFWERHVSWLVAYTLPDVGPRDFRLEIENSVGGTGNVGIRDGAVQIYGVL